MFQLSNEFFREIDSSEIIQARAELFERGYTKVENFVSPHLLEAVQSEILRIHRETPLSALSGFASWTSSGGSFNSVHGLDKYSDFFFDLIRLPRLMNLADQLTQSRTVPFLSEYFDKPERASEPTPEHQDAAFYKEHFEDELALAFWISLNGARKQDGAIEYSETAVEPFNYLPHGVLEDHPNFGRTLLERHPDFACQEANAGDVLIHHSFTVHRSAAKTSDSSRRALALNYRTSPRGI